MRAGDGIEQREEPAMGVNAEQGRAGAETPYCCVRGRQFQRRRRSSRRVGGDVVCAPREGVSRLMERTWAVERVKCPWRALRGAHSDITDCHLGRRRRAAESDVSISTGMGGMQQYNAGPAPDVLKDTARRYKDMRATKDGGWDEDTRWSTGGGDQLLDVPRLSGSCFRNSRV